MNTPTGRILLWLTFVWLGVQVVAFFQFGILSSVDTSFYLEGADILASGDLPQDRGIGYVSYSFLLAIVQAGGFDFEVIVFVHLMASYCAMLSIYLLANRIYNEKSTAIIAAIMYILWIKIHQWNFVVYTDAMFCSLTMISFTVLHFAKQKRQWLLAVFLILFTVFLRPNGLVFLLAVLGYVLVIISLNRHQKLVLATVCILGSLLLVNYLLHSFIDGFLASYMSAEIIYPGQRLFVEPLNDFTMPAQNKPPLLKLGAFIWNHPFYFSKLFILKCGLFLANVKPYFSWVHNLFIAILLYPIYYFGITGFRTLKDRSVKVFILLFVVLQTAIVGLTSENWDGRFLLPILPFVFVLASHPTRLFIQKWTHVLIAQWRTLQD